MLSRKEKNCLVLLLLLTVAFGGLVVKRAAFMQRRMTDVDCYLRAAWAVRTGQDLYEVEDTNEWHYNYPPLFAILMTPLANPPPGADRTGMLPFSVSVLIWYGLSLVFLVLAVNWLASAIEKNSRWLQNQPRFGRSWWGLRLIPVLVCLLPVGHTLMRGQVNLLLLALLCGMAAATIAGRNQWAGWCLAGAICLKVIPAFLLLFPMWRRDWRCLAGCALGLAVLGGAIPMVVLGPTQTFQSYEKFGQVLLGPALGLGSDQSRAKEMIETTANDSQSLQAALHNTLHPIRAYRPPQPTILVRWIPRLVGVALTMMTLASAGWRRNLGGPDLTLFLGALIINMLLLSPVCHLHYFSLCIPIVMGLVASRWELLGAQHQSPEQSAATTTARLGFAGLGIGLMAIFTFNILCYILPNIPGWLVLRDLAVTIYPTLLLWAAGTLTLWRRSYRNPGVAAEIMVLPSQAA
jgi:hypothetical protein